MRSPQPINPYLWPSPHPSWIDRFGFAMLFVSLFIDFCNITIILAKYPTTMREPKLWEFWLDLSCMGGRHLVENLSQKYSRFWFPHSGGVHRQDNLSLYVSLSLSLYIYIYIYIYNILYVYYLYIYIYVLFYIYIHSAGEIYIYIRIYIYIYIYLYIFIICISY